MRKAQPARRHLGPWRCAAAALALTALAPSLTAGAANANHEADQKATALYNVIAFSDWPADAFAASDAPLIIGTLGEDAVTARLDNILGNESCHGRRLVLRRITTLAEVKSCHAVYFARSAQSRWPVIRSQISKLPILTIGDGENFADNSGIVQLGFEQNRLRLVVNLGAAREAKLTISSKLLRLARVINQRDHDPIP